MGSASLLFQHLMNGLTLGGIYALIALGYTMVYGILKFINFAHGDILMVGAYIGLFTFDALRGSTPIGIWWLVSFFIAMVVSMMGCAVLGMAIEKIAYKPLRKGSRLAPLLSAIGVSFILSNGAAWMFGTHSRKFNYPFDNSPISIGGVVITPHQIMVLVVAIVMMVALKIFVDKTKMGKAMRATSLDSETAKLMGVNADMIISLTFGIGSALAACGGMLIALAIELLGPDIAMVHFKDFIRVDEGYGLKSVGAGTGEMDYTAILTYLKKEKPFVYATLENTTPENAAWCVEQLKNQYDRIEV